MKTEIDVPDWVALLAEDRYSEAYYKGMTRTESMKAALSQTAGVPEGWTRDDLQDLYDRLVSAGISKFMEGSSSKVRDREFIRRAITEAWGLIGDMLAAAPAASGVHPDALQDGTLSKSTANRVEALSAASVSERARALLVAECPECGGSNGYMVPAGEHGGAWQKCSTCQNGERLNSVSRYQALRALEQALTQQRGEEAVAVVGPGGYPNWLVSWLESPGYRTLPQGTKLYTTPQPSADAARELVKRILNWQPLTSINKADRLYQILIAAGIPFESITDELESLLSGGSRA